MLKYIIQALRVSSTVADVMEFEKFGKAFYEIPAVSCR
jgi:hypothetical protein